MIAATLLFLALVGYIVVSSFRPSGVPTFTPSAIAPRPEATGLVTDTFTIDARDPDSWAYFDFSRGSTIPDPSAEAWDLAVRRYTVVVNGGASYAGRAGVQTVVASLEEIGAAPAEGYLGTEGALDGDPVTPGLTRWYHYDWVSHTLEPADRSYIMRTADGRYAKFRVLGYYCPNAVPGCLTLAYTYQGDGSARLQ